MLVRDWEVVLPYPPAPALVQLTMRGTENLGEFSDHPVRIIAPSIYAWLYEDLRPRSGLIVFYHGDWSLRQGIYIDTRKVGWKIRLNQAVKKMAEEKG